MQRFCWPRAVALQSVVPGREYLSLVFPPPPSHPRRCQQVYRRVAGHSQVLPRQSSRRGQLLTIDGWSRCKLECYSRFSKSQMSRFDPASRSDLANSELGGTKRVNPAVGRTHEKPTICGCQTSCIAVDVRLPDLFFPSTFQMRSLHRCRPQRHGFRQRPKLYAAPGRSAWALDAGNAPR